MDDDQLIIGETEEEIIVGKSNFCFKKHSKFIIALIIIGILILVAALTFFLIKVFWKTGDKPQEDKPQKDDTEEDDSEEEEPQGDEPTEPSFGLSMEELEKRTSEKYLDTIVLLKEDSPEYAALEEGDKKALIHLVKAGAILEDIELQIDDFFNLPFKKFLEDQIKLGNKQAILTKILFDAQKGINGIDHLSNEVNLAAGHKSKPGMGVYPKDLRKKEFHQILIKMLKENKIEEVRNITNQRSIVLRDGEYLKSIDYVEYFKDDFSKIADELEEASKLSTNTDFNEYLQLQAKALRIADPMLDAYADKKWAELQDTPLELTLTREGECDELTASFSENEELKELLSAKNITPVTKDCLGLRVGIVNKQGTEFILSIKHFLPTLAENMPYSDKYKQDITPDNIKQTMVDVDIILMAGNVGAYRSGITEAENLPNDDKLSLSIGGGRRNVFHRQLRDKNETIIKKKIDEILDPEQHKYYDHEAEYWYTIGHENAHSLGPKNKIDNLGKYSTIIEENKADMGGLAFIDILTKLGFYTNEQRQKLIVTSVIEFFINAKPLLSEAHEVRTVMQNYYFFKKNAYKITENGKIYVDIDKVVPTANEMLKEIIEVQLNNTFADGERYVEKYFVWTKEMELIADKLNKLDSFLNCKIENKLAEKLLSEK